MCYYIPILHLHCGCTTFELPVPNPCRDALKNSMPCLYIPEPVSRPTSLDSAPGLSYTPSTVSQRSDSSWQTRGSASSLIAPNYQHPIDAFKEDDVVKELTLCPFHEEDWLERDMQESGREKVGLAHRFLVEKRRLRRLRKQMEEMGRGKGEDRKRKREEDSPERKYKPHLWQF
ncbi:uncharacterized protein K444DRAFT_630929 [Hyaloscypha bicolor E]|uniref:Uncharacterized protein n=1 Tax=Hyaloscypha bicolor E TaxID=1095630 RepID=A0A2J6T8H7_9HELO|nr:uncharacterized protein K444DRAFT_630929 [Hyaloscypha bicolor E]PMD59326.1 hypothetical protein K444DRAFT_630929 [Hyaloscypha bicolor E]